MVKWLLLFIRFIIPLAVLYIIGYFIPGFSALTFLWLVLLSLFITLGERIVMKIIGGRPNRLARALIDFLVATVVIFTTTLSIQGGEVPLVGALLAALVISLCLAFLPNTSKLEYKGLIR